MDIMFLTLFIFIWLLSGFLTGITSFGGNLLAVPLISLFMTIKEIILIGIPTAAAMSCFLVFQYRKYIPWKISIIAGLGSLAGVPPGVYILQIAGQQVLLLGSALVIFLFLGWQLLCKQLSKRKEECPMWLVLALSMFSGIMNGSVSIGGPPMGLLAYMGGFKKEQAIGFISVAGVLSLIPATIANIYAGMYDLELARLSFLGVGSCLVGVALSFPFIQYMPDRIFRYLLLGTLVFSACMLIYRTFYGNI